jgi:putative transposase
MEGVPAVVEIPKIQGAAPSVVNGVLGKKNGKGGCSIPTILRIAKERKVEDVSPETVPALGEWDVRAQLLQALIPLGLEAARALFEHEVTALAGPRYARDDGARDRVRWGRQRGSIYLADQKLGLRVPRVRDRQANAEVPLQTYARLQQPRAADEGTMRRILSGLSCRDYRACAEAVPEAFGLSRSSMSRRYIAATARKLRALQERRLDGYRFVALVLDGKTFAEDTMVTALGLTRDGSKLLLGFVETGTENATTCTAFLRSLIERGLREEEDLLAVIDGSKGLRAAVTAVFGPETPVQRCTYHKREKRRRAPPQERAGRVARQARARVCAADLRGSESRTRRPPGGPSAAQRVRAAESR